MTAVCVFGGTGFLGQRIVRCLAGRGWSVRVAVRHPDRTAGTLAAHPDRVSIVHADVRDRASVAAAVRGVDAVVNTVSAYVEKPGATFRAVHEQGAETLARAASDAGVERLVLVSGIGADPQSRSAYISARGRGELLVKQAFAGATIVRPNVLFGPGDALFGTLAQLGRLLPALPLIGGGRTRMQPVYVEDVAEAIARILAERDSAGRSYELVGPGVYTLRELVEFALRLIGKRRLLVPIPLPVAALQARCFELLPNPPLTTSQVDLLQVDNLASGALPGFLELGIQPATIEDVVPTYIGKARSAEQQ